MRSGREKKRRKKVKDRVGFMEKTVWLSRCSVQWGANGSSEGRVQATVVSGGKGTEKREASI